MNAQYVFCNDNNALHKPYEVRERHAVDGTTTKHRNDQTMIIKRHIRKFRGDLLPQNQMRKL